MNLLRHFKNALLGYSRTYKIDGMNRYLAADPGVLVNSGKLGGQTGAKEFNVLAGSKGDTCVSLTRMQTRCSSITSMRNYRVCDS